MLTMEMVLHKDVDFAPKFGKNHKYSKRDEPKIRKQSQWQSQLQ